MNRVDIAQARLKGPNGEEGRKPFAYNDATSKRVTCQPDGNLTIGDGINIEVGLAPEEMDFLLRNRLIKADKALRSYSWYTGLDEVRGSVFLDLAFNLGVRGLLHFPKTIHYASIHDWTDADKELNDSVAARRLKSRYTKLGEILKTGVA